MIHNPNYSLAFCSMFREYDIRGRVSEDELNPENLRKVVDAIVDDAMHATMLLPVIEEAAEEVAEAIEEIVEEVAEEADFEN